jgi:hypothetical protein
MSALAPLIFGAPAALVALVALPALWWLLRLTPPRPRRLVFPPTALLAEIVPAEPTPAHTPWWLLLLRLSVVLLLVVAFARPEWRPEIEPAIAGSGPLMVIVDDGWPAAADWEATRRTAERLVADAARSGRPTTVVGTVEGAAQDFDPVAPEEALRRLAVLAPRPLPDDRAALIDGLATATRRHPPGALVWLAHGTDLDAEDDTRRFVAALRRLVPDRSVVLSLPVRSEAQALAGATATTEALTATVLRSATAAAEEIEVAALDRRGRVLATTTASFAAGAPTAEVRVAGPRPLLDDVARLETAGPPTAGGVLLTDESARRRTVGLIGGTGGDRVQPLLAGSHYLEAALRPFADLRRPRTDEIAPALAELLEPGLSMLIVTDVGGLSGEVGRRLDDWVGHGGVLVRFAGPRLAAARTADGLLPVPLRQGERSFGGALSWSEPRRLGPFAGPFGGLEPPTEVRVARQILAEPGPDLANRTWASLDDGTPLVTAAKHGDGWLVLFHVGADTEWSNLPLSGVFVEMLRRLSGLAEAGAGAAETAGAAPLPPWRILDGYGRLGPATAEARPLDRGHPPRRPDRAHPPGLYGDDRAFVSLPTMRPGDRIAALPAIDGVVTTHRRADDGRRDLTAPFLIAALLLGLVDALLVHRPRLPFRRRTLAGVAIVVAVLLPAPGAPWAAEDPTVAAAAREAALTPRLAHVLTGDPDTDDVAERGLAGLTRALSDRTAFEPGEPVGVDPARDELAVYPLLYWPIVAGAPLPDPRTLGRIDTYMKNGGLVVFDSRDGVAPAAAGRPATTGAAETLRELLSHLDLPELEPLPVDHVLGRSFFLLRDFPGRFEGSRPWVEADAAAPETDGPARPLKAGDGVSSILVTDADWIGAWAEDDGGEPLLPMAGGDDRSREIAMRVGINVVMYALTGNYKADQVHVPVLLQRLGR